MTVVDEYLATLQGAEHELLAHMYDIIREQIPEATEELSYAMPAFTYKGKSVIAIMANKSFISLYPFCNMERLGLDLSMYESTKGSIHFSVAHPISDELLRNIVSARLRLL